ncbi:hypothetical protein EQG49_06290 [Periweissella cryptocerci]|uniref:Peptidase S24/S26A/S26B/S26C domain-containing protein n=2 Tax=Periweissella cryptocerci TaxID=2506420 RepID=A0A4P6YTR7_9LACO|nr:hypothetical protein EQG49_06290 [Periweissella cryptocerci]
MNREIPEHTIAFINPPAAIINGDIVALAFPERSHALLRGYHENATWLFEPSSYNVLNTNLAYSNLDHQQILFLGKVIGFTQIL